MTRLRNVVSVWKHNCVTDGTGSGPCDPPCADPWCVETGTSCETFATFPDAMAYADRITRQESQP